MSDTWVLSLVLEGSPTFKSSAEQETREGMH